MVPPAFLGNPSYHKPHESQQKKVAIVIQTSVLLKEDDI
jgi:hypothetical protein